MTHVIYIWKKENEQILMDLNKRNNLSLIALYWITRIITQTFAVFILVVITVSMFGKPPQIEAPNPQQMPLFFLPWFLIGLFNLIPYKTGLNARFYMIRIIISLVFSISFIIFFVIILEYPFPKEPINLIRPILLTSIAISAPLSLYLFRKITNQLLSRVNE